MATKPKTRKPTAEEKVLAEDILKIVLQQHSREFWNAADGEVSRKLVHESFELSRIFHAHGVSGERV